MLQVAALPPIGCLLIGNAAWQAADLKIQQNCFLSKQWWKTPLALVEMSLCFPSSDRAHEQLKGRSTGGFTAAAGARADAVLYDMA